MVRLVYVPPTRQGTHRSESIEITKNKNRGEQEQKNNNKRKAWGWCPLM